MYGKLGATIATVAASWTRPKCPMAPLLRDEGTELALAVDSFWSVLIVLYTGTPTILVNLELGKRPSMSLRDELILFDMVMVLDVDGVDVLL